MKKIYGICLLSMVLVFTASYYLSYQLTLEKKQQDNQLLLETEVESILQADNINETIVTKNMKFIKESYNPDSDEITEGTETIPIALLGLNREEVIDYLKGLSEEGKTYELLSFSGESIKIRETIKTMSSKYQCYLINENGYLLIYDKKEGEAYVSTYISIDEFPKEEQEALMNGKGFESMMELYNYLESHTS